jgi:hypothetical protein
VDVGKVQTALSQSNLSMIAPTSTDQLKSDTRKAGSAIALPAL